MKAVLTSHPTVAVVIPALNERAAIGRVIEEVPAWVDRIVVADNGSTDGTPQVAAAHGAHVVHEPRRGYGAACLRALAALEGREQEPDVVVFLDADRSDFPGQMDRLVTPIVRQEADLVIGSRTLGHAEAGALTLPQRMGNALASALLRRVWGGRVTDLGPFRAIRFDALQALQMDDLGYGWTVQMQARALRQAMRVVEAPVAYRPRIGRSKISGTVRGVIGAGTKILTTIAREALRPAARPFRRHHLMIFARYPEAGKAKTRLIPALGAQGAADLQWRMNHHTLNAARRWRCRAGREVQVRFTGGDLERMHHGFGADLTCVDQGEGDLGPRLRRAFDEARQTGADAAVAIGTDCPTLDEATVQRAFDALAEHDVVLGPASDGGYYLIGMRRPHPELFEGIDWGGERVLAQTRDRLERLGLRTAMLPVRDDVDEPGDLHVWEHAEHAAAARVGPVYSLIIPTLNEATSLPETLVSIGAASDTEVLVVDGGSTDRTREVAAGLGARLVRSDPGRAMQMNVGAANARGAVLVFLHADTRLPFAWRERIADVLGDGRTVGGAFALGFDEVRPALRLIEAGANARSRVCRLPYGDQALFVRRETFEQLGGFRALPVMEDYEFVRRLRRHGQTRLASGAVLTSARRWHTHGIWRTTITHQLMVLGWFLGLSPARLAAWRGAPSATALKSAHNTAEHADKSPPAPTSEGNRHDTSPPRHSRG